MEVVFELFTTAIATRAIILTDKNFTHDTQAVLGSRSSDWLFLFCEPNHFERCAEIMPVWDELCNLLAG
jgi:hypothetical protein